MIRQKKSRTEIISAAHPDCSRRAATVIREGGIVAFPTETYYGLGVDPFNMHAVERLFQIKRRPLSKPILVIIDDLFQLQKLTSAFPEPYKALIRIHWPGPLTLIFPANQQLSTLLTGGSGTIGIRMTSGKTAAAICQSANFPVTATSANISSLSPAASVAEIVSYFNDTLDLIVDGGRVTAPMCSTIATIGDGNKVIVLRQGMTVIDCSESL